MTPLCFLILCLLIVGSASESSGTVGGTNLTLQWRFPDQDHIRVSMVWKQPTYLALLLGDTMTNSDLWLCSQEKGMKNWTVADQWSTSHKDPQNDTSLKGTDDLTDTQVELINGTLTCSFTRKLVTADAKDKALAVGDKVKVCSVTSTTAQMQKHSTKPFCFTWPIVDNYSGDLSSQMSGGDFWSLIHGLTMTICWGLLVDVGVMVARYFRARRYYVISHAVIFFLVDITTIPMAILMIVLNRDSVFKGYKQMSLSVKLHLLLGVALVATIVFQHLLGGVAKHKQESSTTPARRFLRLKRLHKFLGYLLYFLTKAQLGIGWYVYGGHWTILVTLLIVWCGVLILTKVWLQCAYRRHQSFFKRNFSRLSKREHMGSLIEDYDESDLASMFNSGRSTSQIQAAYPHLKYVQFKNMVCDVEGFLHPGGNSLVQDVLGRDVSKYVYGGAYVEGNQTKNYRHSEYTLDYLHRRVLCYKGNLVSLTSQTWQLREVREIAPEIFKFTFTNPGLKMPTNPKHPASYLGKFWLVTTQNTTRPYTVVLSMLDQNVRLRSRLREFYSSGFSKIHGERKVEVSDEMTLIIKRYNNGTVSRRVHESVKSIEGVYGQGLPVASGVNVVIAGGTGILPFLDLFDLLLKKAIALVASTKGSPKNASDPYDIDYVHILPDVQVILYASFSSLREFNCYQWLAQLHQISKEHSLNLFQLHLRLNSRQQLPQGVNPLHGRVDEEFCRRNLRVGYISRVLICGPPKMADQLHQVMANIGLQDRLTIL